MAGFIHLRHKRLSLRAAGRNDAALEGLLRSGDHAKVARWQKKQAILRTLHRRPDLFYKLRFPYKTRAERKFIAELEAEDDAFRDRNPKNLDYRK